MKGVQLTGYGGLEKLRYREDIPLPAFGPRDVLIKVGAAGVNNTDLNTRVGWYLKQGDEQGAEGWSEIPLRFPRIQGADVCGRVVAAGDQVDTALLGARVLVEPCLYEAGGRSLEHPWYFGSECDGGFAQYTVVAARHAHRVESGLSDIELASFPCSYSTAENLLTRAGVGRGERVLVTGASGGVGSAVIQLAGARGARVVAVTSPAKSAQVLGLGAERTLGRDEELATVLGKSSVDVVIDLVGGRQWPALLDLLRPFGRYATSGAIAGPFVDLDLRTLYLKDLTLFGCTVLGRDVFPRLIKRIEAGQVSALVAKTFALTEIALAQTRLEERRHIGKFVIDVSGAG
ncbi:MAG: alcohol dehydrogenase [Candidatus Sedimenticola endophacoides]|uniref:Alcohol dehydrogenase n=1 Tax=Candidatus Sedimenticola endophacoides TaxID=2548426 RepID=A0A6N4DJK5_9GAMM|nr:MAG: alcohol dehydrogenase [Candidatus Sedimenticola endophacoides]OQX38104.1 MAG: alcohol dehydrogenase [Candidatus Sedimenticola endophacoides]OQX38834.1 MAG: alcohol dehydrogenase [Candidatus Sedimenticola endophacoides]OQX44675.1 MAG: alcohol dehydrogenase [Candidatus Sedimenticola endophacoides]PUD98011.1 MAG: alcohol dehydrogenase [Candidatus Sedimenticola endophacoides]